MRRTVLFSLFLVCGSGATAARLRAAADEDDPLAGLSGARALEFAKELSSDAMLGRRTGAESGRRAEEWIQGKLTNMGIDPMDPEGIYMNAFPFATMLVAPPIGLIVGTKAADYGTEFKDLLYTGAGTVEAEVVFVGYGICAKDRGLDDYEGVDVKGKIALALRGAPANRESEFAAEKAIGWKSAFAADRGALGFLICDGSTSITGTIQEKYFKANLPALWVTSAIADAILKPSSKTLEELKKARDAGEPSKSFATGTKARMEVHGALKRTEGRNVIGGFRGSDPDLRGEAIIVGAHLDHLGVDALGRVFNGADDNASGSSSLLMLAETLAKNAWRPKRSVIFAWFAGEDQGLAGSRAMANDPVFPHKSIVAMINMDMTGQGTTAIKFGGGDGYPELWHRSMEFLAPVDRAAVKPFRAIENSDHWPFHERGIPAFFAVTDGDHPNYHQLTDDAANLKPECLEAAARVVGRILVGLANIPTPLHTGREAAGYILHEGARAVEGKASAKALDAMLARPPDVASDRFALTDPGWSGVIVALDERAPAEAMTWSRLEESIKRRAKEAVLVRTAAELVNGPPAGRTAILPRYACFDSARKAPVDFGALRTQGVRWIDPFDPAKPLSDTQRNDVLAAAASARLIVDLTGLAPAALTAARLKLGTGAAIWRTSVPLAKEAKAASTALTERRKALGPNTLVLLAGGAEDSLLSAEVLAAPDDPTLAPVAVVSEDTAHLLELLGPVSGDLEDPAGAMRGRVRSLFGGTLAEWLRRIL